MQSLDVFTMLVTNPLTPPQSFVREIPEFWVNPVISGRLMPVGTGFNREEPKTIRVMLLLVALHTKAYQIFFSFARTRLTGPESCPMFPMSTFKGMLPRLDPNSRRKILSPDISSKKPTQSAFCFSIANPEPIDTFPRLITCEVGEFASEEPKTSLIRFGPLATNPYQMPLSFFTWMPRIRPGGTAKLPRSVVDIGNWAREGPKKHLTILLLPVLIRNV